VPLFQLTSRNFFSTSASSIFFNLNDRAGGKKEKSKEMMLHTSEQGVGGSRSWLPKKKSGKPEKGKRGNLNTSCIFLMARQLFIALPENPDEAVEDSLLFVGVPYFCSASNKVL